MNEALERRFAMIGARVKVERASGAPRINVGVDRRGEFFALRVPGEAGAVSVVDADRDDRCLLPLVRDGAVKSKFLCGFDERHWFVAAIPESARAVGGVDAAKDALQPEAVRKAVARVRPRNASVAATRPTCGRASGSSWPSGRSRWTSTGCSVTSR